MEERIYEKNLYYCLSVFQKTPKRLLCLRDSANMAGILKGS